MLAVCFNEMLCSRSGVVGVYRIAKECRLDQDDGTVCSRELHRTPKKGVPKKDPKMTTCWPMCWHILNLYNSCNYDYKVWGQIFNSSLSLSNAVQQPYTTENSKAHWSKKSSMWPKVTTCVVTSSSSNKSQQLPELCGPQSKGVVLT